MARTTAQLALSVVPAVGSAWSGATAKTADHNSPAPPPLFDDLKIRAVEAIEGQTLLLPCTVKSLGDRVVSWIRSRDLHILTSGPFSFSSDDRFEPVVSLAGDFWGLRIRGVFISDTGQYECQVNTDPKMSLAVNLTGAVKTEGTNSKWVGRALIKGPTKVFVRDGSPVAFTCEISPLSVGSAHSGVFMTSKPRVRWLHDNQEILLEGKEDRISMDTHYSEDSWVVTSILRISEVSWRDSGQYTCLQMSVKPDSVKLIATEAEHSEAMQRDDPIFSAAAPSYANVQSLILVLSTSFTVNEFCKYFLFVHNTK